MLETETGKIREIESRGPRAVASRAQRGRYSVESPEVPFNAHTFSFAARSKITGVLSDL